MDTPPSWRFYSRERMFIKYNIQQWLVTEAVGSTEERDGAEDGEAGCQVQLSRLCTDSGQ